MEPAPAPQGTAPAEGPARVRWRSSWPALLALAGVGVLAATAGDEASGGLASAGLQAAFNLLAAILAFRASRRLTDRLGRAWAFLGWSSTLAFLGLAGIIAWVVAGQASPSDQAVLALLVVVNSLSFVGLVLLAPAETQQRSSARLALDGLLAGGSILFAVLALRALPGAGGLPHPGFIDLLYPAIDAAGLAVLLLVAARRKHVPAWFQFLLFGMGVIFVTDSVFVSDEAVAALVADSGYLVFLALVAMAALDSQPWPAEGLRRDPLKVQAGVYGPVLAALVTAAIVAALGALSADLVFFLLALMGVVLVRTVLLLSENRDLYADFEATDSFKTQLLRFISHEIANPLSPLKVQTEILRSGQAPDPARQWASVDRSIARLESLSRDVRLMALAETKRIVQELELADVSPRVAGAVQAHQAVAALRKVTLRADLPQAPVAAPIDGERFDQVVDNLLSNALKFTPAGGTIDVRLWRAPGGAVVLEVKDSGAGMTPEQQQRLFSAFGRPKDSTTPGLGLGLYLCKAIVDGHGGRISATSDGEGQGSRFRVELPPPKVDGRKGGPTAPPAFPAQAPGHGVPEGRPPDLPV